MSRLNARGILLGVLVHFGTLICGGTVVLLIYLIGLRSHGVPPAQLVQHTLADRSFIANTLVMRLMSLAAGAFVAARIAKSDQYLNAIMVWLIVLCIGLLPRLAPNSATPPGWYLYILLPAEPVVAVLAAFMATRWPRRDVASGAA